MASRATSPSSHPSSEGLQSAIRDGVQSELDKRGVGGGGGGNDRLAKLERDVSVIQSTMVTREALHIEWRDYWPAPRRSRAGTWHLPVGRKARCPRPAGSQRRNQWWGAPGARVLRLA